MTEKVKRVAKRKLSDITFEHDTAHVALTAKDQGGPANGHDYALVMKSNFPKEIVEKIQQVRVTMELPEFLRKFFDIYGSDAEILARMMGYVPEEIEREEWSYEDWIQEQMDSFEILKSAHEGNHVEVLASLDGEQYLTLLQEQEELEKVFSEIEKNSVKADKGLTEAVAKTKESDKKKPKVKPSNANKGKTMDEDVKVETVEKSQFDAVQKALDVQKEELKKALEALEVFKAEKKAAIEKARFEKVKTVVADEKKAEEVFKALAGVESDSDFETVVSFIGELKATVEKSALFEEKGVNADEVEAPKESAVAKVIKSNLKK